MREELEKELIAKYPALFRGKDKPATESLMCFGCECDDGWFDIINNACKIIQNHMKCRPECPPVEFSQIKEKFGGLRLYYFGGDEYVSGVCSMAELMSYSTCEISGMPGTLCRAGTWLRTLSPEMAAKHNYEPLSKDNDDDEEET
jgi:hypothetical protein